MRKKTVEEYLETIYEFESAHGHAHTGEIAKKMGVKPPSVTEMMQKLKKDGYVKYSAYTDIRLTPAGKKIAADLMGRHKAIADFLAILGVERQSAEKDACQIEHHVRADTVRRIERFVEFANLCPQSPIWIEHFKEYHKTGKRRDCSEGCKKE
jgi:DtxR family Mn-dependent transcriptional regulator